MTMTRSILLEDDTARVRLADPETSHEAADSNDVHGSQVAVTLTLASNGPLADHELVQRIPFYSPSRVRTARHELVEQGVVTFHGIYRLTDTEVIERISGRPFTRLEPVPVTAKKVIDRVDKVADVISESPYLRSRLRELREEFGVSDD